ncbi:flagella synthesis protein FlgN [Moritella viscosa]|uniref:Flagellar protein FlgN n=1 Tax=Moritella viscosa TaxID=80854 RepID=A0A090IJG0_9GAMM|nr:flagellar protein FlgN [Moritella viscosa]CED61372.1 flagellar protein FlgN [Moritella viscosa]SGY88726.1 Putative flagellar protein FlgN [Moritella viscosa]SGY92239.1 Putative flagellar protein FlgN [Moritella viscosa]SGY95894.1 Putative flagellar protein FlgN [Moritella viscosa]SGY96008.1 Putative flagellar protein FlgN [Moritella viscosa]
MTIKTLPELLVLQVSYVEQLLTLLTAEKSALESRDVTALEKLSQDKEQKITQVAELDVKINLHPDAAELLSTYLSQKQQIETELTQCQELNDVNGKLIELNLRNSKRLTDTIVRSRSRNNITYDKLGRTRGSSSTLGLTFKS